MPTEAADSVKSPWASIPPQLDSCGKLMVNRNTKTCLKVTKGLLGWRVPVEQCGLVVAL